MAFYGDGKHNEDMEYVESDVKLANKPKFIDRFYEGSYKGICFELKDTDGEYPSINWLEDWDYENISTSQVDVEEEIIQLFLNR